LFLASVQLSERIVALVPERTQIVFGLI